MRKASDSSSIDDSPKFRAKKRAGTVAEKPRENGSKTSAPKKSAPEKAARKEHAHASGNAQRGVDPKAAARLHDDLLGWYAGARRDLPWRRTRDPYAIWLSEVMLQQTRVDTVIPYYERFLTRWPTVHTLADAPLDDVLTMWSGLGYYRRARMLHAAAQQVSSDFRGAFPSSAEGLAEIKGIGRYTAGAVASIAFGVRAALVDGNVARVLARIFAVEEDVRGGEGLARIWALAEALVHDVDPGSWNQALMELGATVCVPRDPRCLLCPVRASCRAREMSLERELPRLAPKAKPKAEARWALVATHEDAVLLGRRRPDLRFGGMWEPPLLHRGPHGDDGDALAAIARFEALTATDLTDVTEAGVVTHVLSHRRMEVAVLRAHAAPRGRSGKSAAARAPLPAPLDPDGEYDRLELVPQARLAKSAREVALSTLARKILDAGK